MVLHYTYNGLFLWAYLKHNNNGSVTGQDNISAIKKIQVNMPCF